MVAEGENVWVMRMCFTYGVTVGKRATEKEDFTEHCCQQQGAEYTATNLVGRLIRNNRVRKPFMTASVELLCFNGNLLSRYR